MPEDRESPAVPVPMGEILWVFARIGLTSFGGGLSAWIYREVVEQRRWLSEDEFLGGLTLSQILPGPNVVNLSIYVGQHLRGAWGGVLAAMALLLPPMITIVMIAELFHRLGDIGWIHDFLEGIAAAAIGLTIAVGLKAARHATRASYWPLLVLAAVFGATALLRWPLLLVVLGLAPVGLAVAWRSRAHAR